MSQAIQNQHPLDPHARQAMVGAFLGFFVDMFDVWLPVIVLGPAIGYFAPKSVGPATLALFISMVFIVTLVARPLGALIFGNIADRFGRKRIAMVSVGGFGLTTLLIGCLPGYATWGFGALIILVILRFVDGLFLAGEYTSASPLAMEYCPKERRGFYGALIMGGFPASYIIINLLTFIMLHVAPLHGIDSAYVTWGWRIPLFIGAFLSLAFVLYYRVHLPESEVWEQSKRIKNPLRTLLSGNSFKGFIQVWLLMTGFWLTSDMISAVVPGMLHTVAKLSESSVTLTILLSEVVLFAAYLVAGVLSQRFGRRKYLMVSGIVAAVVGGLLNYALFSTAWHSLWPIIVLTICVEAMVGNVWGLATTYINERFQTNVRASGFGLGYSLAVVLPAFYAFYQLWLGHIMPAKDTELLLMVIGAMLIVIGAAWGPETRDVEFAAEA